MMQPSSADKMLETMMMQILSQDKKAPIAFCCSCFKEKKRDSQNCCKCGKNKASKHKKRRGKMKKSCLKTIICLSKMAKDSGCLDCPWEYGDRDLVGDEDERYCSKCGQPLPGQLDDPPTDNADVASQQVQRPQLKYTEVGVQANIEHGEPLALRIKVCPCPDNRRSKGDKLYHTVSSPELSKTNPTLVDDVSSENLVTATEPRSIPFHQDPNGYSENSPEWRGDAARVKALALKLAKARMIYEESRCREKDYACRQNELQRQNKQRVLDEASDEKLVEVDPQKRSETRRPTYATPTNYNQDGVRHHYAGTSHLATATTSMRDMSMGCCADPNAYCYSPQTGPIQFGSHCEHACSCQNDPAFDQPYNFTEPYLSYQPEEYLPRDYYQRARSPCR